MPISDWQIFLAMNVLGFNYFGMSNDRVEFLNGISGSSNDLLSNSLPSLALKKVDLDPDIRNKRIWQNHYLLTVDDYYLPYNPFYGKKHNQRFVVAETDTDNKSTIFDAGYRHLSSHKLDQATVAVFSLRGVSASSDSNAIDHILMAQISDALKGAKSCYIGAITEFAEDLTAKATRWERAVFETMYFCINRPAGPTIIRQEMGNALGILGKRQKSRYLIETSRAFLAISHQWETIGNLFFKLSRNWSAKVAVRVYERILKVAKLEGSLAYEASCPCQFS